jgi:hypothetical protein
MARGLLAIRLWCMIRGLRVPALAHGCGYTFSLAMQGSEVCDCQARLHDAHEPFHVHWMCNLTYVLWLGA